MPGTKTTPKNDYGFESDYAEYDELATAGTARAKGKKAVAPVMKSTSTRPL